MRAAHVAEHRGWFRRAGEFPSAEYTEIPVAEEAQRVVRAVKYYPEGDRSNGGQRGDWGKDFANYRFDPRGGFMTEKLVDDVLYEE